MYKSTFKQPAASRANAQKSTGPSTSTGKAQSRFDALKHGIYAVHQIMFDEKPEDLAELAAESHEQHSPADAKQRFLVDTLVANEWRLRRMRGVQAELWRHEVILKCTSGDAFATGSNTLDRLQRIANSCERIYHRALKELEAEVARAHGLRSQEPEPAVPPQPKESETTSASSASFGQNPQTPPAANAKPNPHPKPPVAA